MYFEGNRTGLTVIAATALPIEDLATRLQEYSEQKRQQGGFRVWLFLGNQVIQTGLILAMRMIDLSLAQ